MRETTEPATTPLNALHRELGATMVEFAGYDMPVRYPAGILREHQHTRAAAGLFDVSHMGQVRLTGPEAPAALESLVPGDIIGLQPHRQRYTLFTNQQGGILDDLMVTQAGDHLFLVINAACKAQDVQHLRSHLADRCGVEELTDRALLALQGPAAHAVMERMAPRATQLTFMTACEADILGARCFITRSGYTGEDGFEISVPATRAEELARALLDHDEVEPVGLGARDSLRLEAGLCLYGHDLTTDTTPVEANLRWVVSKARRADGPRAGGYPGADVVMRQFADGVQRLRVGIRVQGRAPVREGAELVDESDTVVGHVTSGTFGPSVGAPVAMAYVRKEHSAVDTALAAIVRGRRIPVTVAKMPFVPQRYHRG
ncbi:MAG: glycine cleavage system aminomethyltransferase GcvT [Ectothiorhodospiraceae bacterium]|jgi:aminomethyltransferase